MARAKLPRGKMNIKGSPGADPWRRLAAAILVCAIRDVAQRYYREHRGGAVVWLVTSAQARDLCDGLGLDHGRLVQAMRQYI